MSFSKLRLTLSLAFDSVIQLLAWLLVNVFLFLFLTCFIFALCCGFLGAITLFYGCLVFVLTLMHSSEVYDPNPSLSGGGQEHSLCVVIFN